MKDPENHLLAYVRSGDEAAFAKVVEAYSSLVYGTAYRKTRNVQMAEEITQNVFVLLACKAEKLVSRSSLGGWLHRSAVLDSQNLLRSEAARQRRTEQWKEEADLASGQNIELFFERVDDALSRLSESDRMVVIMRFYEEKEFREIGAKVGKSAVAVQKKIRRALDKLNRSLTAKGATFSLATIGMLLSSELAKASPLASSALISAKAITATTNASSGSFLTLFRIMTKSKITVVSIAILSPMTGVGAFLFQHHQTSHLKEESALLRQEIEHENKRRVLVASQLGSQDKPIGSDVPEASEAAVTRNWKALGESMFESERDQDFATMLELMEELRTISAQEALQGLSELPQLGMKDGPLETLKRYLYKTAIQEYPEKTLNYFINEYKSDQNDDFDTIILGFKPWVDKELSLAVKWLDSQIEEGVFQSRSLDETHVGLAMLEAQLLNGLLESNPEALSDRLQKMPPAQVMLILDRKDDIPFKSGTKEVMDEIIRQVLPEQKQEAAMKLISK